MQPLTVFGTLGFICLSASLVAGCAHDRYERDTEVVKEHVDAFYTHLENRRVAAAVQENEQIEAVALRMEARVLDHPEPRAANRINRDWLMMRRAYEAAAQNWLALARFLVSQQRYEQARGTYERLLATYTDPEYRVYAQQARAGLQDLDMIIAPSGEQ